MSATSRPMPAEAPVTTATRLAHFPIPASTAEGGRGRLPTRAYRWAGAPRAAARATSSSSRYATSRSRFVRTKSKSPGSAAAAISPSAFPRRLRMLSSPSVPRPRRRASSSARDGGMTNTNVHGRPASRTDRAPCTSMSSTQHFPVAATAATAALLVP